MLRVIMIETEINSFPQIEKQLECCKHQARFYARLADIALDQVTLDTYTEARLSPSSDDNPLVSDQQLLFSILNPEQKSVFKNAFKHIDFDN